MRHFKIAMAMIFSGFFFAVAILLVVQMIYQFVTEVADGNEVVEPILAMISKAVIALATFELGIGITKEYPERGYEDVFANVRRTTTRFFGVVSIALVLEALILVIKYSQLELAGNLYYPVAIICSAAVLIISLGLFLHLTQQESGKPALSELGRSRSNPPGPATERRAGKLKP